MKAARFSREIQGLRAVCISIVMLFHFVVPFRDALLGGSIVSVALYHVANAGWIGVDVFFAISGFVVTQLLLRSRDHGYVGFMRKRAARLLPAYFALLSVVGIVAYVAADVLEVKPGFFVAQLWAWSFTSNVAAAISGGMLDGGSLTVVHLWSLCVEFQFYAAWPLLVWGTSGRARPAAMCAVAGCALFARSFASWNDVYYNAIYSLTFFRMDAFAFGGLAALAVGDERFRRPSLWLAVLTLAPAAAFLVSNPHWHKAEEVVQTIGYTVLGLGSAALVFALNENALPAAASRILRSRAANWMGDRSYSLYLWHLPFQPLLNSTLQNSLPGMPANEMLVVSLVLNSALAFSLAEVSYRLLEKRIRAGNAIRQSSPRIRPAPIR